MSGHYDEKVSCQNSTHVHTLSTHSWGSHMILKSGGLF